MIDIMKNEAALPDIILIDLGSNDIALSDSKCDMRYLVRLFLNDANHCFPRALLVWSDMLCCYSWKHIKHIQGCKSPG